jgi:thymidylate synthase
MSVGSVGQNYSAQWRNFNGNTDQVADLISMMKNIMSSRLKMLEPFRNQSTALPPCHSNFKIYWVPLTQIEMIEYAENLE